MSRRFIAILCLLAASSIAGFMFWYFTPARVFERMFWFQLPESAAIMESRYTFFCEERLYMKVRFGSEHIQVVEDSVRRRLNTDERYLAWVPRSWWGMGEDESILLVGHAFRRGRRVVTHEVFAIITIDESRCDYVGLR